MPWRAKTELQRVFVERLKQEMMRRGKMSASALARESSGAVAQTTISAILRYKHDPTLETVHAISQVLGLPAWFMLTENAETRVITPPKNVVSLPTPYPQIFGEQKPEISHKPRRTKRKKNVKDQYGR